jgi:hypothetical protein
MATLCKTYASEMTARRGVEALRAAGVPGRDIQILTGGRVHDVRKEPVGGFARALSPDAPVGSFGDVARSRRQGVGAFAGDPDRQRQGSFADADRDVIVTHERGGERSRVTGDLGLRRLLREADLVGEAADRAVDELHAGRTVVLVELAEMAPSDAQARLDEIGHAA